MDGRALRSEESRNLVTHARFDAKTLDSRDRLALPGRRENEVA